MADRYFVQRLYVGVEPEEQTSRELKDRYGVFAYAVNAAHHAGQTTTVHYRAELDGESFEFDGDEALRRELGDDGDRAPDHPFVRRR